MTTWGRGIVRTLAAVFRGSNSGALPERLMSCLSTRTPRGRKATRTVVRTRATSASGTGARLQLGTIADPEKLASKPVLRVEPRALLEAGQGESWWANIGDQARRS